MTKIVITTTDKELSTITYAVIAGIVLCGLALASIPYLQHRAFLVDCYEMHPVEDCKSFWRIGND